MNLVLYFIPYLKINCNLIAGVLRKATTKAFRKNLKRILSWPRLRQRESTVSLNQYFPFRFKTMFSIYNFISIFLFCIYFHLLKSQSNRERDRVLIYWFTSWIPSLAESGPTPKLRTVNLIQVSLVVGRDPATWAHCWLPGSPLARAEVRR